VARTAAQLEVHETHLGVNTFIALLRAINLGSHNKVPMAELRSLCSGLGWKDVTTYIQSGNVIFRSGRGRVALAQELEEAIADRFGYTVPVVVRTAEEWAAAALGNPFPDESDREPNRVMLASSKLAPEEGALEALLARASEGERVGRVGDALWIYYSGSVARTKLTPAHLDRAAGSPVTTRNWRTVTTLQRLSGEVASR
jgi:uncharacterized protein (DUF1697 family)